MDFMGEHGPLVWGTFTALVAILLWLDLGVLNRRSHALSMKEAATWSACIVVLALLFGLHLLFREGTEKALEYYTGYLIELSLSVDNLFVFLLIFQYFAVPAEYQPRILKWGILSAIVLRGIMIALGALLLAKFHWIVYVFGGILVVTGYKMLTGPDVRIEPERNPVVRAAQRFLPFSSAYEGNRFFLHTKAGLVGTPLLLVLIVVEWSDVVFAIDSIPAVFAVTRDPFIVYSSNVFAILGLRALFFVLASALDRFRYLKPAVAGILVFVGVKMGAAAWIHIPTDLSLIVVATALVGAVVLSLLLPKRSEAR